jgi:hypothetical protein
MIRKISSRKYLAAGITAVCIGTFAHAYTTSGAKWKTNQVVYYVDPTNLDVSSSAALGAIRQGGDAWGTQSKANISLVYGGPISGGVLANDGKNEVFFRNATSTDGASVIATTYTWWDSNGNMTDGDMVFWDASQKFFTGTSGCSGGVYIEDVATHEFGHMLGLNHSTATDATMYPSVTQCAQTGRTLASDDIAGIQALYPPVTTSPSPSPSPSPTATASPSPTPTSTVSLPTAPVNPSPANWATGISTSPILSWTASTGATSYDLYFGTTTSPALVLSNFSGTRVQASGLARGKVYYWRVVAKNSKGAVSSSTWRFTTY